VITIADDKDMRADLLAALADGTRAEIVQMLATRPRTAGELHGAFPIAAPAVSRHLRVLRETGLVEERRPADDRRVRLYALRPEPLAELAAWLDGMSRTWQAQLDSFKDFVALRTDRPKERR
jgi:DNA-binding transcriptional ArsR family regulator